MTPNRAPTDELATHNRDAGANGAAGVNGDATASPAEDAALIADGREVFRRLTERPADLLRFATAGSVDDGKSTLIGRLLYDSKQVLADQLEHIEQTSRRMGHDFLDLSLLTDGLRAEREQGITIDVAYRYFATSQRRFIIADTPGHEQYTRNMVTGASTADLAIILIDARRGVVAQSKRHAFISSLLAIPHVVVCVNKMDLVDYKREVFDEIVEDFDRFAARLEMSDVTFIPISALLGDNVVERSRAMPWYQGPPLLYHLEHVHIASDRNLIDVRFPVQGVIRPQSVKLRDYRAYTGQVAGGVIRPGDEVVVLPGGSRTRVAAIDTFEGPIDEAFPPMSVALRLEDDVDVSRGSTIVRAHNQPTVANSFEALLCWMSESPLDKRRRYVVKHTARSVMLGAIDVRYRIQVETLHRDETATTLELNDLARVHMELSSPLVFDSYRRNRPTGSLIVIDEATNETVAAGVILDTEVESGEAVLEVKTERSPNVRWQGTRVTRGRRWQALGRSGATVWFTGLPGAGKSTVAGAVEERLIDAGHPAFLLDGDNLRHGLNGDLGFDEEARRENVRRTSHVARLLAESGTIALVSLVSPYAADRDAACALHDADELAFLEVFVDAPLEVCEERDPKGLYARARAGHLAGLTGVGAPYEAPLNPDLVLDAHTSSVEEEVERVLALLRERGLLG
jgi:bifunctional enzyme CysN/CysC